MYKKKLVCGFRRPKNLCDHLMRAKVPPKEGDEKIIPVEHDAVNSSIVEKAALSMVAAVVTAFD